MANEAREQEIWKPYPKIPFIEASNLGRIRTKDRYVPLKNGTKRFVKGRVLKQYLKKSGYMYVSFGVNGKKVCLRVHRIVATCFVPNPNGYPQVNHKDNDRTNNSANNLEWCTCEYNNAYRERYGKARSRPVIAVNTDTSEVFWFESQREAGRQLGICQTNITQVAKGKIHYKTAGGYWFCDADENAVKKTRKKFGDEIAEKVEKLINENYS